MTTFKWDSIEQALYTLDGKRIKTDPLGDAATVCRMKSFLFDDYQELLGTVRQGNTEQAAKICIEIENVRFWIKAIEDDLPKGVEIIGPTWEVSLPQDAAGNPLKIF